jgi:predicted NBD/HSP70 family sugar kinase
MATRVGIDIGGTKMLMLAETDGDGDDTRRETRVATGIDAAGDDVTRAIAAFLSSLPNRPASIGVAIPGLVRDGRVADCDVLPRLVGWAPPAIGDDVAMAVLNDAEAALVEEAADLGRQATAAVVVVGTGIGAAVQVDGRICRGASGWAGELGFAPIWYAGEVKTFDEIASGAAIVARLGLDPAAIRSRAEAGDAHVRAAIADAGTTLGLALATVINLFNPERLSLFGGTLRYPGYLEAALAAARRYAHPKLLADCAIRTARDDGALVAKGAMRRARQTGAA